MCIKIQLYTRLKECGLSKHQLLIITINKCYMLYNIIKIKRIVWMLESSIARHCSHFRQNCYHCSYD